MLLKRNGTRTKTEITSINAELTTSTCGTAMQRTVYITAHCEMTVESARGFAQKILEVCNAVEATPKGCNRCEHSPGCPEKEEKP